MYSIEQIVFMYNTSAKYASWKKCNWMCCKKYLSSTVPYK